MKPAVSLALLLLIGLWVRCYNHATVFVAGDVYFVDPDCYSRMSRVQMVMEHPFTVIHHQDFENYPQGVTSHATAPFDYLIVLLAFLLKPFSDNYLDLAGALISPLLGIAMLAFLWEWTRRLNLPFRWMVLLLAAVSPIIVHGTVLGRPDHQSLEMLCITVALGAEWCLLQKASRGWAVTAGAAWGLGLWASLYEPLVLFVATMGLYLVFAPRKLRERERLAGWIVLAVIVGLMLLINGLPVSKPTPVLMEYFPRWEKTIGELTSSSLFSTLLYRWVGLALIAAPVFLFLQGQRSPRAICLLILLVLSWGLALWQARWGYFFATVYAMTLPYQFTVFKKAGIAWAVFAVSMLPLCADWGSEISGEAHASMISRAKEAYTLRRAAESFKSTEKLPVLAPWWFAPEVAYWSGQPAVAGSSHESLPGIVDTSRFYLTDDTMTAHGIVYAHGVKRVIVSQPANILEAASKLLNQPAPDNSMAYVLFTRPSSAPTFLKLEHDYFTFKVFRVESADSQ